MTDSRSYTPRHQRKSFVRRLFGGTWFHGALTGVAVTVALEALTHITGLFN